MSNSPWYCHDCETTVPTMPAARRHAKEAGPVTRPDGKLVTHKFTRSEDLAIAERHDRFARFAK